MFVSRSSWEYPRPFERWVRTMSPSSTSTCAPRRSSSAASAWPIVVLPAPERPVSQTVKPVFRSAATGGFVPEAARRRTVHPFRESVERGREQGHADVRDVRPVRRAGVGLRQRGGLLPRLCPARRRVAAELL